MYLSRTAEKVLIWIGWSLIGAMALLSVSHWVHIFQKDYASYQEATKCVAEYVASGVERKDIVIIGNTCKVKTQ